MPPTLASLVQHSALKLTVRAGADRLDTPVRWAHASEARRPRPVHGRRRTAPRDRHQPGRRERRVHAAIRAAAGRSRGGRGGLRRRGQLRGHPGCPRRRRRGGGPAAPRSAPPHPVPRHQQGRLRRHRRRPVPRGHRRLRGPARADEGRARRGRPRRPPRPPGRPHRRLGRAVRHLRRGARRRPRLGRPPRRPPHPRRRTPPGQTRPRQRRRRGQRGPGRASSRWAPAAGRAGRSPSVRERRWGQPSGTPCTPPSPCSP